MPLNRLQCVAKQLHRVVHLHLLRAIAGRQGANPIIIGSILRRIPKPGTNQVVFLFFAWRSRKRLGFTVMFGGTQFCGAGTGTWATSMNGT
jgi:hypothetical protein